MTHPVFPLRAVTALFLERQHLTRPRAHRLSPGRLTRFVEDVGGVQMDSINVLDRPVIVAYLMIIVLMFVIINLLVDLAYTALDPRVRVGGRAR